LRERQIALLELRDVEQRYGRHVVLRNFSAVLAPGITGLLGPNGAGKTTLLRTMATVMPPTGGQVIINGVVVVDEKTARVARRNIGYLPQDFGFDPNLTLADFVTYGAWQRGVPKSDWRPATAQSLAATDLTDKAGVKLKRLSGGMRQRAGIAWAIVGAPRLVLLDEPTVGLDPKQRLQFRKVMTNLRDTTVVLSTHLIDDVSAICDRVLVLGDGKVRFDGPTAELAMRSDDDLPGHSELERAYMNLLPKPEQEL
jgi:ABC-2 type transport system ATP-binding protein